MQSGDGQAGRGKVTGDCICILLMILNPKSAVQLQSPNQHDQCSSGNTSSKDGIPLKVIDIEGHVIVMSASETPISARD